MSGNRALDKVTYEFHVARQARDRYQFDEAIFQISGNVVFANFHAARVFAQKMNDQRDLANFPERAVRPGQISAMGLIDEISHFMFRQYRQRANPQMLTEALAWLDERVGPDAVDKVLTTFSDEFPPVSVYRREQPLDQWLQGETDGMSHREIVLEELLMLWLGNMNPAFNPFLELFDDARLERDTAYGRFIPNLYEFFATQPSPANVLPGIDSRNLIDLLRAPALASPHSLEGQLTYILQHWAGALGKHFLYRLLSSMDIMKEEGRYFLPHGMGGGDATAAGMQLTDFRGLLHEPEKFTPDREWMPRVVLLAKNAFVWLDQLSKRYGRSITTLDQIPDEELDTLARRGFTGLWLIGLWERSAASKRIKQIMGNPEAVASAYSLYDYVIAYDLGGQPALDNLRERAWQRGIRLASDMVPNHVGIDGRWVVQHPDWFIQLDYPPYPVYSFNGPDLSPDERVTIQVEDHYYNHSDAAVVFKRYDHWTGATKYIYHGNDGTSMPWNDTAQLNYLNPEVREAVIQTILHVARQFPIIRFDAAMTLAKRHYQRLWYPEPGSGGDIPSRAEHGLTKAQFDAAMPEEFWREVVDRCAAEAPDTLLLAEAFWLMEGYFVRTLGMHRVYNSAFMVMLRDEDNAKYRMVLKNTQEFEPEIMRRYVNFMNNPDERTAVEQFGKGDKYFGICTMMVTMPGLPMFGHGQVEGFTEKYGMEYRKAYWDEQPDEWLIARHEREIFPLMHKRYLFAGVENFLLYDFYTPEGHVNEDVFAFSNRHGDERGLVVYHNKWASARGWIRSSAAYSVKAGEGRALVQRTLGDGLGLRGNDNDYVIFRDLAAGLEYIRHSREIRDNGMYIELGAYNYHVFFDFREVADLDGRYGELHHYLGGRGVSSVDDALREIFLRPIHSPLKALVNADMLRRLVDARVTNTNAPADDDLLDEVNDRLAQLCVDIKAFTGLAGDDAALVEEIATELNVLLQLPVLAERAPEPTVPQFADAIELLDERLNADTARWATALTWLFVHKLGKLGDLKEYDQQSRSWIDEWLIGRVIEGALRELELDDDAVIKAVMVVKALTAHQRWYEDAPAIAPGPVSRRKDEATTREYRLLKTLMADNEVQQLLGVNRHQGVLWFSKEGCEDLAWWFLLAATVSISADQSREPDAAAEAIADCSAVVGRLFVAAENAGYQVEKLLAAAKG